MENVNKVYQLHKRNYYIQVKNCSTAKNLVETLIESKSSCESVIKILQNEINLLQINKDIEAIKNEEIAKKKKSWSFNIFGTKKKQNSISAKHIPISEDIKIMNKRLESINQDLEKANMQLLDNVK